MSDTPKRVLNFPVHLRGLATSPDQSVIARLESLLAAAKRGEVIGIAGVVEYPGRWQAVAVGAVTHDCGPYIGWIEILKSEMVDIHKQKAHRTPDEPDNED